MKNETILKKAIEKAEKNGWKQGSSLLKLMNDMSKSYDVQAVAFTRVIFSHDFAKAFWGEEDVWDMNGNLVDKSKKYDSMEQADWIPAWQYHLQQMVLEKDPIKYLEKFL